MLYRNAKQLKSGQVVTVFDNEKYGVTSLVMIVGEPKEFVTPFKLNIVGASHKRLVFMVMGSNLELSYLDHKNFANQYIGKPQEELQDEFKKAMIKKLGLSGIYSDEELSNFTVANYFHNYELQSTVCAL